MTTIYLLFSHFSGAVQLGPRRLAELSNLRVLFPLLQVALNPTGALRRSRRSASGVRWKTTQDVVMDDLGLLTAIAATPNAPVAADAVRQALVDVIGARRYGTWFSPEVEFRAGEEGVLEVRTPTLLERNLLRDSFGAELTTVYRRLTHNGGRVVFRASDEQLTPAKKAPVRPRGAATKRAPCAAKRRSTNGGSIGTPAAQPHPPAV